MYPVSTDTKDGALQMKNTLPIVMTLGGHISRCGYAYLATAVSLTLERGQYPSRALMRHLYPDVAALHSSTTAQAARNIARVVEDIWMHGDRQRLCEIAGYTVVEKPTPGELILMLANYISGGDMAAM